MPLIEELPVTSTIKASHGWAYVPDTGPIVAQQPGTRDRKRAAVTSSKQAATATAKQQKAIQVRLVSLSKENYKDGVTVPIPTRTGSSAREKAGRKMTNNVRRILTYQRGFAHYLADEEANNPGGIHYQLPSLATAMGPPPAPTQSTTDEAKTQRNSSRDEGRRRTGASRAQSTTNESSAPGTPTPSSATQTKGRKRGRPSLRAKAEAEEAVAPATTEEQEDTHVKPEDSDIVMIDAGPAISTEKSAADAEKVSPQPDYPPEWDNDPLLSTTADNVPRMPSERIMQLLISEPPLTYNAARATPLDPDKQRPPRHFCGVCGYWGKVKCRKCEDWSCGIMECWKAHEAVCAMANLY